MISRELRTQDAYVSTLRQQRIATFGVDTCGAALAIERHLQLWGVLLDILDEEDWQACLLLRRLLRPAVRLVVITSHVAPDHTYRERAREIGCAAFIAKDCKPELVTEALDRVGRGETWVECV